jgi:hypothetical protein
MSVFMRTQGNDFFEAPISRKYIAAILAHSNKVINNHVDPTLT